MANAVGLLYLAITLATAAAAVVLTSRFLQLKSVDGPAATVPPTGPAGTDILRHYRYREGYLLSNIDQDDAFLDADTDRSLALPRLAAALKPLSPEFSDRFEALCDRGDAFLIDGRIGSDTISIGGHLDAEDGVMTLTVGPSGIQGSRQVVDTATLDALQRELTDIRAALDAGSTPMWRVDGSDRIIWANEPFFDLVQRLRGGERPGWPLPDIFASQLDPSPSDGTTRRCQIDMPDRDEPSWYEVSRDRLPGGSALFAAHPADRVMRAETSLRDFLQTTAKTFAALPIGLAVFDSNRQLVTFNPALCTLTQAGPEFLSGRPDLRSFLDQLREKGRIPEPRDYRSWRDEIALLEQGARKGTYHEMWELPEGKTFRVIGRPHPDGAIAFMFEDISAEVSLTRQFRDDLDMFQAVLDATPSAIAVFDADGAMIGANTGYSRLWGRDPRSLAKLPSLTEATALWSARCEPSGIWGEIRQFVSHEVDRAPWVEEVRTEDGTRVAVRMAPTRGRSTVIHFIPLDGSLLDPLADLAQKPDEGSDAADEEVIAAARSA